jgi:hypothetical protein
MAFALNKLQSASRELKDIASQVLEQSVFQKFTSQVDNVLVVPPQSNLNVELLVLKNDSSDFSMLGEIGEHLTQHGRVEQSCGKFNLLIYDMDHFPNRKVGEFYSTTKVLVVADDIDIEDEDFNYIIQRFLKDVKVLELYASEQLLNNQTLLSICKKNVWSFDALNLSTFDLNHVFQTTDEKLLGVSQSYAMALSIQKLGETLDIYLENEKKDLDARKLSIQKELDDLKKNSNSRSGQELFMQIKNFVSKSIVEFEKGVNERISSMVKPQTGSLIYLLEDEIETLNHLDEVKEDGQTKLAIPKIKDDIKEKIHHSFSDHFYNDIASMNDFLQVMVEEIKSQCENIGLLDVHLNYETLPENKFDIALDDLVQYEKEFDAKAASKGFMAVFSAARQPMMIIVMVVSVIGMFMQGQDIRKSPYFLILLALAIIFGIYNAITSGKKEKTSKFKEELKKAKQHLKTESRRIISNIDKEVKPVYSAHLKNQIQQILEDLEYALRIYQENRTQKSSEDLMIAQKKAQTLNIGEKKLDNSTRSKLNFDGKLAQLVNEFQSEIGKIK